MKNEEEIFNNVDDMMELLEYARKLDKAEQRGKEEARNEELSKLSAVDRCYELIKEKHANWIGISNQEAIKEVLTDRDRYFCLYETALAKSLNESLQYKRKHETELELLNEGWKQELKESIKKDDLRSLLVEKLNDLNEPSNDRWESDEEKHSRLIIEIKLLKSILGENSNEM